MLPLGLKIDPVQSAKKVAFQLEKLDLEEELSTFYKILGMPYERKRRQSKRKQAKQGKQTMKRKSLGL
jgi:hypothetical protein